MTKEIKYLYAVKETQPMEGYMDTVVAIYETEKQARLLARLLNKEHARGVFLNEYGDFEEEDENYNRYEIHYYDIEAIELNRPFEKFGVQSDETKKK